MNLWLRLLRVLIASFFRPRLDFTDTSELRFRVMPHDLDINIHMNNARYFALMDLGRFDLIARTGMWRLVLRRRWQPVIGSAIVRFRRPLKPFQPVTLSSRVFGWDEKWLYIEHRLDSRGVLACHTVVRGAFVGQGGVVPPSGIVALLGPDRPSPPLPAWIAAWTQAEAGLEPQPDLSVAKEAAACAR
jgi:acyl-CoA thioesterase FadM